MDARSPETDRLPNEFIADEDELRTFYPNPKGLAAKKTLARLDKHCRKFIRLSPFICLASSDAEGNIDVSPKGDAPGFVEIVNDSTLLIPDRMGNNRVDSMRNVLDNPHIGIIFMIPGIDETLRVNGRARISRDDAVLHRFVINRKAPTTALLVEIDEAFLHCSKAFRRSKLWDEDYRVERKTLPTLGRMVAEQIDDGTDPEEAEASVQHSLKTRLY